MLASTFHEMSKLSVRRLRSMSYGIHIFSEVRRLPFLSCIFEICGMKKAKLLSALPYSNRISPWLTEFGPLPWQAKSLKYNLIHYMISKTFHGKENL